MIYYVEDDQSIRELVIYTLNQVGFQAMGFESGESFFDALNKEALPELILLDVMLPGDDGITILKKIKKSKGFSTIPVIMLTAKGQEYDKVTGLDHGADDYVTKPFGMMELIARIKAVLRRTGPKQAEDELFRGGLRMNVHKHTVTANGRPITLTFKEFELLRFLLENKGLVFDREKLLSAIWGYDYFGGTRTVDVHVQTLRQKLGDCAEEVQTIRGIGYRVAD